MTADELRARLEEYNADIRNATDPNALIALHDRISQDLTTLVAESTRNAELATQNAQLLEANQKLFLRVTTPVQDTVVQDKQAAKDWIAESIKKGEL